MRPVASRGWGQGQGQGMTAAGLAFCLLVLQAVLFSQVAAHALTHAHHKAATHGSLLCTWLCTAGETSEAVENVPSAADWTVGSTAPRPPSSPVARFPVAPSTRAPPPLSR